MAALTVRELMTQNPTWCTPQDAVAAVARLMVACNCGALPVVEDPRTRRLAGIITDRDIVCRVVAKGLSPVECRVREAMTPDPASLHLDATVDDCVRTMETLQVRRLPITDDRSQLIGMVAQADLARAGRVEPELESKLAELMEEVSEPALSHARHPAPDW